MRGVATNKSFLFNVLNHPDFINNQVDTTFIEKYPELLNPIYEQDRANKMLRYIGEVIVNGPDPSLGASGEPPSKVNPVIPNFSEKPKKRTLYHIYKEEGPKAFAKAVRENKGLLVTDTTWRDAHQSLLATRMRTYDILQIARDTNIAM